MRLTTTGKGRGSARGETGSEDRTLTTLGAFERSRHCHHFECLTVIRVRAIRSASPVRSNSATRSAHQPALCLPIQLQDRDPRRYTRRPSPYGYGFIAASQESSKGSDKTNCRIGTAGSTQSSQRRSWEIPGLFHRYRLAQSVLGRPGPANGHPAVIRAHVRVQAAAPKFPECRSTSRCCEPCRRAVLSGEQR